MTSVERLRVALDATPLLGVRTGVGTFVAGALRALATDPSLELCAYALSLRGGRILSAELPAGVAAVRRPMAAGALLRTWSRTDLPPAELWTGTVDVVHGTNFTVPPARRAAEVVTVHDVTPLRFAELAAPTTRAFPALVRRAIARGALVHTPSAFVAAEVVWLLGADPERVHAVPPGIPEAVVAATPPDDAPGGYVLALGTVEPRKDLPTLVQAFDAVASAHPRLRLVIAGSPGWDEAGLDAAIERAVHRDRIERLGYVEPARRSALLRGASVFAYPAVYEGFGFPPLEAMAAGVPVVASRAGALPEVLGDGAALVPAGDRDALAEALGLVLQDDDVRAGLVERGRRRASEFSWEACGKELASLYRRAAAG